MIDLPPEPGTAPLAPPIAMLASAIADLLAHLYTYAGDELTKLPHDPGNERLLDIIFDATAEIHDLAGEHGSDAVREMLGDFSALE